jgi:hypothetical protein
MTVTEEHLITFHLESSNPSSHRDFSSVAPNAKFVS